ncbi:type II and III secretion system protein family protein [Pseudoduganella chitinolytica]|uniref:Type II and III secretion system protein family protein n=1 Tax=Pseudoduganella chitinolytica TaxID=34070 RepID=A0ABY8B7V9_9BURK|nr:type II and III secretion system protein family protein [Pseudoduganella chitinolytica]WEF32011.1 type II and III secretion system protein family protein [Pseudoduganella chitinolytica]
MTLLTHKTVLACALAAASAAVAAAPARDCIDLKSSSGTTGRLELVRGKSVLKRFCSPASQVTVGAPEVANVVVPNASEIVLVARSVGSTNLIVANKDGHSTVFDIDVKLDTAALREQFAQLFPTEKEIHVGSSGNAVVLSGMVSDSVVAAQLVALATSFQDSATAAASTGAGTPPAGGVGQPAAATPAAAKVMNMLQVAAPQQVMLEVKIAEISKSLVDQLGASLSRTSRGSSGTYGIVSSLLSGGAGSLGVLANSVGNVTIDGEKRDGLVKILAEPTVMAISGQEASFLAGGKIFIPVAQNSASGANTITLEEKEYGVAVKFTPTVLAGGRINLRVAPEVSELNREGIGITTTGGSNAATAILPAFTTRRATTTVQLQDGQSFAIGGLIRNNVTSNIKRFPFLGDVPVLGTLFRSSDFQNDRTELVFIVTPHLAKPLQDKPRLPTDDYVQPTPGMFFIGGRHEGFQQPDNKKDKP